MIASIIERGTTNVRDLILSKQRSLVHTLCPEDQAFRYNQVWLFLHCCFNSPIVAGWRSQATATTGPCVELRWFLQRTQVFISSYRILMWYSEPSFFESSLSKFLHFLQAHSQSSSNIKCTHSLSSFTIWIWNIPNDTKCINYHTKFAYNSCNRGSILCSLKV